MLQKKDSSLISLAALLVVLATASTPVVMSFVSPVLAQSTQPSDFPVPATVPQGTTVQIDGSNSMAAVNQALTQKFQQTYPGTQVSTRYGGSTPAIQSLLDGKIDLAAIGRLLTPEERAQGVKTTEVVRRKIAVIVGAENSFTQSLTNDQFAKIFRGEITNWSEVGGPNLPIRFIDRPLESDTRQALRNYPVFRNAPFESGANAVKLTDDSTAGVIEQLGKDGVGYAIVDQVANEAAVRIVPLHSVLPTDRRYSFSQPLAYAYTDKAGAGALAFLGFATAPAQQAAIESAQIAPAAIAGLSTAVAVNAAASSPTASTPTPETAASPTVSPAPTPETPAATGLPPWLWWLLPLGLIAGLLGWLFRRGDHSETTPTEPPMTPVNEPPVPSPIAPVNEPRSPQAEAPVEPPRPQVEAALEPDPWIETTNPAPPLPPLPAAPAVSEAVPEVEPVVPTAATRSPEVAPIEPEPIIDEVSATNLMADATPNPGLTAPGLGGAALATGAAVWAASPTPEPAQVEIAATKFEVGSPGLTNVSLADVDAGLTELPNGYGESRIVLLPRDPQWAYAYWDAPNEQREALRQQGGQRLALRVYDVTAIDLNLQSPHSLQQYDVEELAREWFVAIPVSDRDYVAEIGYLTEDGRWLMLARSTAIRVPPVYPANVADAQMLTIDWEEDLHGKTFFEFTGLPDAVWRDRLGDDLFAAAQGAEAMRLTGSLYGSMQQVPASVPPSSAQLIPGSGQMMSGQALSSFVPVSGVWMSGVGMMSGIGMSGVGLGWQLSGIGMMSGVGMSESSMSWRISGVGMSGIGFAPALRSRKFWLLADAELIVYGATEPTATVTIDGRPVQLNPDGTFRFQMPFPDGRIDFPIMAIAIDGEQTRYVQLRFDRETPLRRTNSPNDAVEEQF
jgi:ABC-type phosphate transport system substrate-binding protein